MKIQHEGLFSGISFEQEKYQHDADFLLDLTYFSVIISIAVEMNLIASNSYLRI